MQRDFKLQASASSLKAHARQPSTFQGGLLLVLAYALLQLIRFSCKLSTCRGKYRKAQDGNRYQCYYRHHQTHRHSPSASALGAIPGRSRLNHVEEIGWAPVFMTVRSDHITTVPAQSACCNVAYCTTSTIVRVCGSTRTT